MTDTFDATNYEPECKSCHAVDGFARVRTITEVQYLRLETTGDNQQEGWVEVDSEDTDQHDAWDYKCVNCDNESSCIEDLLLYREEDDSMFESKEDHDLWYSDEGGRHEPW